MENLQIDNETSTIEVNNDVATEEIKDSLSEKDLALMEIDENKKKRKRRVWNVILTLLALFLIQFGINYNLACTNEDPFLLIPLKNTVNQELYLGFGYTYDMSKDVGTQERVILDANVKLLGFIKLQHIGNVDEDDVLGH